MPPDQDKAFRWRREDAYITVEPDAFAKKVHEDGLTVKGPFGGYWYAMVSTTEGQELWRTNASGRWLYQARRVATQANVAGGAVKVDITPAAGQTLKLIAADMINSGTNAAICSILDEDNAAATNILANVASGAATRYSLPSIGSAATATGNATNSTDVIIMAGQKLSFWQSGAGAQNDTLTVAVVLELIGSGVEPTWSKARSTNEADVTLAANTISTPIKVALEPIA